MTVTLPDLDLRGELRKVRENPSIWPRKVSLAQMQALQESSTPEGAVRRLLSGVITMANNMHEAYIEPYNPVIGAISILLHHPAAKPEMLTGIEENRRERIEQAVKERNAEWNVGTLEWQLVLEILVLGENAEIDVHKTLTQQEFENEKLQHAWDVLMELNMLRIENKL